MLLKIVMIVIMVLKKNVGIVNQWAGYNSQKGLNQMLAIVDTMEIISRMLIIDGISRIISRLRQFLGISSTSC